MTLKIKSSEAVTENPNPVLVLSAPTYERFSEVMANPPAPNEKLSKAARAKKPWK